MSEHRLHVLTLDELQRLCYALGIKPRSDKLAAIKDLVEAKIQYHELGNMSQLKRMLEAEGQQVSGRRSELEQRLIATHPGQAGLAAAGAPSSYEAYGARAVQQQKRNSLVARDELEAAVGRSLNNELVRT